jgi:hypothetical protein
MLGVSRGIRQMALEIGLRSRAPNLFADCVLSYHAHEVVSRGLVQAPGAFVTPTPYMEL